MSIIGIILLIGIVKKNAIMMIDFALNAERNEGKNTRDSIFEASMLRFRPILMTTMAALFGAVPLALGTGMGSELRRPLGISIIGGLIVSQVLTLYTTPVIYLFMDNLRLKLQGRQACAIVHAASREASMHEPAPIELAASDRARALHPAARRLQRRAEIHDARGARSAGVQGIGCPRLTARRAGHVAARQAAGRGAQGQVVGDLQRAGAQRARRAVEYRQPEHRAVFSELHGGARAGARGPRRLFSHGDGESVVHQNRNGRS